MRGRTYNCQASVLGAVRDIAWLLTRTLRNQPNKQAKKARNNMVLIVIASCNQSGEFHNERERDDYYEDYALGKVGAGEGGGGDNQFRISA